ncbi:TapB family protein [Dyadobacter sp.]|uniref:TapB family protein n=1 Tax=Dyadobacter sp. TaxID=1914288 RepID=UPI003F711612
MKNRISYPTNLHCRKTLLAVLFAGMSLVACKETEPGVIPDVISKDEKAIIPAKDQRFVYKIQESDGTESSAVTKVLAVRDSAGIAVYDIENKIQYEEAGSLTLKYNAFSKDGKTTNEISTAAGLNAIVEYIGEFAIIKSSELSGLPQRQIFENKATVGSKVTFSSAPVRQYMELEIPIEDGDPISAEIECLVTYHEGKAVKEESVTTPAGTFNCTKWEYSYDLETKLTSAAFPSEESAVVYTVHLWTAPGIGIVKSEEFSGTDVTKTELQKIEK